MPNFDTTKVNIVVESMVLQTRIKSMATRRSVYRADAYLFVFECVELSKVDPERKILPASEGLLKWAKKLANERYGVMSVDVLQAWGVQNTLDFGRIFLHLVEEGLLSNRQGSTLGDFIDKFDFDEAFSLKARAAHG